MKKCLLAAKYDVHFTLKGICKRRGIRAKITSVGNKIMEMRIAKTKNFNKVIFRDSLLLFPMKLDDCPKTFDLRRNGCLLEGKSRFPYAYNRAENYGVRRESLPPSTDYLPVKMSKDEKAKFMEWYNAHRNEPFDLCEALAEYCSNDTLILIYALVHFRQIFNEVAGGTDIFIRCCTITGGCIRLFRHRFLKEKTLAVVPNNGYLGSEVQSGKALKFIKWFAAIHNVNIQHRDSDEGEYRTLNTPKCYRLDGYIPLAERLKPSFNPCNQPGCAYCEDPESTQKDIALEFNGCAWHGCPECFPDETRLPNGKKSDEA